jgi:hypothetical protein
MSFQSIIRIVLLAFVVGSVLFLIAKEYGFDAFRGDNALPASSEKVAAPAPSAPADAEERFVLFYFYGNRRCFTCRTIEKYLAEELEADFATGLVGSGLEWRPLNVEEPENRHFITDLQLVSSTAVIAEMKGGSVERSKKLDLVWKLARDEAAFKEYVRNEVLGFMEGGGGR